MSEGREVHSDDAGGERPEPARDSFAERARSAGGDPVSRDATPALGTRGQPGPYQRAAEGAEVGLHRPDFEDMRWSFLYDRTGSDYRDGVTDAPRVAAAARRRRESEEPPEAIQGPVMKAAVWTWEIPLYFWFGGIAAGSSFVALACDIVGDHASAATARKVTLVAVAPCPALLVSDLGRPARFLNMLRIFKPRSPMSMGAWCLTAFGNLAAVAVTGDVLGRPRLARGAGAANAVLGSYLGSYAGILLASTAVPIWARSRHTLGPTFIATATASGAAACRLALAATGLPVGHPTRLALGRVETGGIAAELAISAVQERRLGPLRRAVEEGVPGRLFKLAKGSVIAGLALRALSGRAAGPRLHHVASALYLGGGLAYRYAWLKAGVISAHDDESVVRLARSGDVAGA